MYGPSIDQYLAVHMSVPDKFTDRIDQGMFEAIGDGDLERVKKYVEEGADITRPMDPAGSDGATFDHAFSCQGRQNPLRLAAIRSQMQIVKVGLCIYFFI